MKYVVTLADNRTVEVEADIFSTYGADLQFSVYSSSPGLIEEFSAKAPRGVAVMPTTRLVAFFSKETWKSVQEAKA